MYKRVTSPQNTNKGSLWIEECGDGKKTRYVKA